MSCGKDDSKITDASIDCVNKLWQERGCVPNLIKTKVPKTAMDPYTKQKYIFTGDTLSDLKKQLDVIVQNKKYCYTKIDASKYVTHASPYQSVISIRTQLKELHLLQAQYQTAKTTYNNALTSGLTPKQVSDALNYMNALNDDILHLISQIQRNSKEVYGKGVGNQNTIDERNDSMNALLYKLQSEHYNYRDSVREFNNAAGGKDQSELIHATNKLSFTFYFFLAVFMAILVISSYMHADQEDKNLETVVLTIAIILVVVKLGIYFYKKI